MSPDERDVPQFSDQLSHQQLLIFAKEMSQLYQEERRLREELEEERNRLELRNQELAALNQLFQKHLSQQDALVSACQEALQVIQQLGEQAISQAQKVKGRISDLSGLPQESSPFGGPEETGSLPDTPI